MQPLKAESQDAHSPSAASGSAPPSGTKRKRDEGPKFYAVRVGRKPGVYYSWNDAKAQLDGVKGHLCQKFTNLKEAEEFVATGFTRMIKKYYGVRRGRVPGVYTHWPSVQEQITGWTKPQQRAFDTRAEAEAYVNGNDNPAPSNKKQQKSAVTTETIDEDIAPGDGPVPPIEQDSFDSQILLDPDTGMLRYKTAAELNTAKMKATRVQDGTTLRVYTDGSSLSNGQDGAAAGIGIYFGPRDPRNTSEALPGQRQTNQRAELAAIQRALDLVPRDAAVTICTDSRYSISCVTDWSVRWRANGWKTAAGKPVENRDLVEPIVARIEQRKRVGAATAFEWIKGHADDPGNVAADALAVAGARGLEV